MTEHRPAELADETSASADVPAEADLPGADHDPDANGSSLPVIVDGPTVLTAEQVEIRLGAVGRADTRDLRVSQGAVGAVRAEQVSVEQGAVGAAIGDRVEVSRGYARAVLSRQAVLDRAAARVVVAGEVSARQSAVMFLVARKVDGDVRVLFDWRGALAFGAVAGLVIGLLRRRGRAKA